MNQGAIAKGGEFRIIAGSPPFPSKAGRKNFSCKTLVEFLSCLNIDGFPICLYKR